MKQKINLEYVFKKVEGDPLPDGKGNALTLRKACIDALTAVYRDEQPDGEEKVRRYKLAMDIYTSGADIALSSEEVSLLKQLIGKYFAVIVVGQAYEQLDETEKPLSKGLIKQ